MKKLLISLIVLMSSQLFAAEYSLSKIGTEIKGFKNRSATGVLFGWRYLHHRSEAFSIGGAAYTGQFNGDAVGSFSYGGLVGAYGTPLTSSVGFEFSLMAGGAGGFTASGTNAGGIVLEPGVNFGFVLGKYVRASVSGNYIWLPSSSEFSAIAGGLRFEFLTGDSIT